MKKHKTNLQKLAFRALEFIRGSFSGLRLRELHLIRVVYDFLFSHLKPDFVEVEGSKIYLDSLDTLRLYKGGLHEPFITEEIFKKEIKEGDVVLDLGAHIGYYTLLASRLVGPKGKVFAFEPDLNNFTLLKKSVEANGYRNIVLEQKGIARERGTVKFFLYGATTNSMAYQLYNSASKIHSVDIEVIGLDDYFKNYDGNIDFIKMDIEGAEGLALAGMRNLLLRNKNVKMIAEFAPAALKNVSKMSPVDYLEELLRLGFKLYEAYPPTKNFKPLFKIQGGTNKLDEAAVQELIKRCTPKEGECFGTNLFCFR